MVRSMLAIAAGYFSMAALNSFSHLIVSFYFRSDITLTGIAHLPSSVWVIGFTILQLVFGLFGGLLTTTLANAKGHLAILGLLLLMVIIGLLDYSMLSDREPQWYLIVAPALKIAGIFLGYRMQLSQINKLDTTS